MSEGKLRIGIIGVGSHALLFGVPDLRATGRVEVVAICRRTPEKLAMAQKALGVSETYTDWREMLDRVQLDAVVVSTPHYLHAEQSLAALERGLHVLVGKPMALTSQDAWAMVEAAEQADRVLMVSYPGRLMGIWQTVRQTVADGVIGPLRQINIAQNCYRRWFWAEDPTSDPTWEVNTAITRRMAEMAGVPFEFFDDWPGWHGEPEKIGGGQFVDTGSHALDRALSLASSPPVEAVAFTESLGLPVEAYLSVQARLANGVLLTMTASDAMPESIMPRYGNSMTVVGDQGLIFVDRERSVWLHQHGTREKLEAKVPDMTPGAALVSTVLDDTPNLVPPNEGAWSVDFMEAMYTSAAEGCIVRIERHASS